MEVYYENLLVYSSRKYKIIIILNIQNIYTTFILNCFKINSISRNKIGKNKKFNLCLQEI